VHRDLKPANLFLCRRAPSGTGTPFVKLLDFGISKLMNAVEEPNVTRTHAMLGSPLYMSPEQLRSPREVDARSDIWALGAVLYQLVSGEPPFQGETLSDLSVKIATEAPRPLTELLPDASPALVAAVARCLEKDRRRRYPDVAALALDLVELGGASARASVERILSAHEPGSAAPVDVTRLDATLRPLGSTPTLTASSAITPVAEPRRSRRWPRALVVVGVGLVAALAIQQLAERERAGASATTSTNALGAEPGPPAASIRTPAEVAAPAAAAPAPETPAPLVTSTASGAKVSAAPRAKKTVGVTSKAPRSAGPAPTVSAGEAPRVVTPAVSSDRSRVFDTRRL